MATKLIAKEEAIRYGIAYAIAKDSLMWNSIRDQEAFQQFIEGCAYGLWDANADLEMLIKKHFGEDRMVGDRFDEETYEEARAPEN